MKPLSLILMALLPFCAFAQSKKVLDHPDFAIWKQINGERISNDGSWISYEIAPGEGDPTLVVYEVATELKRQFPRGRRAVFTDDSRYLVFTLTAPEDSVKALKRRKVEKEKLPGDTLAVVNLATGHTLRIPNLEKVSVPEKWNGAIVYQVRPVVPVADTTEDQAADNDKAPKRDRKAKKPSEKTGFPLILRSLDSGTEDTLAFVTEYTLAKERPVIAAVSTGIDSVMSAGVYLHQPGTYHWTLVKQQKGKYQDLALSTTGDRLAFLGDTDTTKVQVRPYALYQWRTGIDSAIIAVDNTAKFLTGEWIVSQYEHPKFAENGRYLFFGTCPIPPVEDTTLLESEKVEVEVWHYQDPVIYTQQNVRAKSEKERAYLSAVDLSSGAIWQIANGHVRDARLDPKYNSPVVILTDDRQYHREMSWTGELLRDVWVFDLRNARHTQLATGVAGNPNISTEFSYVYWYHAPDSLWYISAVDGQPVAVSNGITAWDEEHDAPGFPSSYGAAGWLKGDRAFLMYDRYDIWQIDPKGIVAPKNLTNGRAMRHRYRYADLDKEHRFIDPSSPILLSVFDEVTKRSGYARLDLQSGKLEELVFGPYHYQPTPLKARDADVLVFTEESFQEFPDLNVTTDWFQSRSKISHVNPQQKDYQWGTIELFKWKAFDGKELEGLLVKPDNFDPAIQYPMIVNFYERSSDDLYQHRVPFPHRSTINYHFYASRGYVIFNPNVVYDEGHPGESAYNCVVSGTQALINAGFIDPQRIGLQGHSWGGYQIAYLITKTGIYKCAESGAPVVNMTSAYGGIRWSTGLSRMFQYEHEQSRIGASLWEKPELYLENSPLFELDKVSTPVLIMSNDHDGSVPWYQGIEFFTAMRRLNKPAWLLNYPGEDHWPQKLPLRKDFNIRLQQFFDYYLKDAPEPMWMKYGLPATEKGILQGLELESRG